MAGTLTRDQMVGEILDNLSRSTDGTTRNATTLADRAVTWLNRAQIIVARNADLLFAEATTATVADQKTYAFPANVRSVFTIRLEDGLDSVKLRPAMPWEFDRIAPKPDEATTGRPDWYTPYKTTNTFELFRIPDQAYTMRLRYSFWPADLAATTSVSEYTRMDDVLISFGTREGFRWLQEINDARFWDARSREALEEALEVEKARSAFPDWVPAARGFTSRFSGSIGEYYNDPFVLTDPNSLVL